MDTVRLDAVLQTEPGLIVREIGEETIIVSGHADKLHILNNLGQAVWTIFGKPAGRLGRGQACGGGVQRGEAVICAAGVSVVPGHVNVRYIRRR